VRATYLQATKVGTNGMRAKRRFFLSGRNCNPRVPFLGTKNVYILGNLSEKNSVYGRLRLI